MKIKKGIYIWDIEQFIRRRLDNCSPVYSYFVEGIENDTITTPYGVLKVLQHDLCLLSKGDRHYPVIEEEMKILWEYITDEKLCDDKERNL